MGVRGVPRTANSRSKRNKLAELTVIWRGKPCTTRDWSITGFTMGAQPFKRLGLGEQEDVQLQFMVEGMEVRFPALIEVTRTNQRRREVGCRFMMIDPRGERLMRQYLELHGEPLVATSPAATGPAPEHSPNSHQPHQSEPPVASSESRAGHDRADVAPPSMRDVTPPRATGPNAPSASSSYFGHDAGYEHDDDEEFVNPVILIYRALRGRWVYACVAACIASIVVVTASYFMISPIFQSRGLIRISAKEQKILYADSDDSRLRLFDAFVSSELTYLTSRPVLDRALYLLNQSPGNFDDVPDNVADLSARLDARKIKSLLEITADAKDPESAKVIVNAVLDGYQQLQVEQLDRQQTIRERELIAREQDLLSRIDRLKGELLTVGGEYNMSTLRNAHQNRLDQIEATRDQIAEITNTLINISGGVVPNNTASTLDSNIQRAIMQDRALADLTFERTQRTATLTSLRERYAEGHPLVLQASTQLQIVNQAITERQDFITQLGRTGALSRAGEEGFTNDLSPESLQAKLEAQKLRETTLLADAERLNSKLLEVGTINGELEEHQDMLQETRRVLEQVRVESGNSLPGTIEILSRGSLPERAAINRRKSAAMLAVVAAFGMTGAGFIGFSLWQRRVRYSDEMDGVDGIEMLGVIDQLGDLEGMAPPLISQIRAELEIGTARRADQGRAFVVARIRDNTDSALLTLQLANSFAATMMQTLVIDGDPTTGRLTELSQAYSNRAQQQGGLPEHVGGVEDLMNAPIKLHRELSIIPGGAGLGAEQAAMSAEAAQEMIEENRVHHDCVLYQGGVLSDDVISRFVATKVDGIILVIDRNQKIDDIQREVDAARRLTHGRVFGVFVNAVANDPGLRHGRRAQTGGQFLKARVA